MDPSEHSRNANQDSSQRETRDPDAGEEATATTSNGLGSSQNAQRASSPSTAGVLSVEASGSQIEGLDPDAPRPEVINSKAVDLVLFLLLKYRRRLPTCKAEILYTLLRGYEDHFPVIFTKATECLRFTFGIEVIEKNPRLHSYTFAHALGLTYDGMRHGFPGVPKVGLVIIVLCIIFIQDNCASEQELWRILNNMGLYAGRDHFVYGDPGVLISEHFVQEGYLECREVPGSDPPTKEYLWGPRAHAETTKMKVLKFFASIVKQDPRSYPTRYADALKDEIDRA